MLEKTVLQTGRLRPDPDWIPLRCGPLALHFDPLTGNVRYVKIAGVETIRSLYAAVRDANWNTLSPRLHDVHVESRFDGFRVHFEADCQEREIHFVWKGVLEGFDDGTLRFTLDGTAKTTFRRNRIGFCVLHPVAECAGRLCKIETVTGEIQTGEFPRFISPHQPFRNMRAITQEVLPGVFAEVRMEGDTFEMEDQRNWTDASFKTYSTPLALPYPVEIAAGTQIHQSVTLSLHGKTIVPSKKPDDTPITLALVEDASPVPLPAIGLGLAELGRTLTREEVIRLRHLHPAHLRLDLPLEAPDFPERLANAAHQAAQVGDDLPCPLEIALFLTDNAAAELQTLADAFAKLKPLVARWLVFHRNEKSTAAKWVAMARKTLAPLSDAPIGAGTNAYFAELNRERPETDALDFVCFSLNPQVHAFNNVSLVENMAAQADTVRTAQTFANGLPVVISPVTLRPRFNPYATGPEAEPAPGELPFSVDVRQMSLLGAGWTLGSLKYLAESGAASITFYETIGPKGVMESETGAADLEAFPSLPGMVFPSWFVLQSVWPFAKGMVLPSVSSEPLSVEGLVCENEVCIGVLCANLTAQAQNVVVKIPANPLSSYDILDAENGLYFLQNPRQRAAIWFTKLSIENGEAALTLPPYALARLTFRRSP